MITDKPISNSSAAWLREMAELETEECFDDTYPASLVLPATPPPTIAPRSSLVSPRSGAENAPPDEKAAAADAVLPPHRPVVDGDAQEVLGLSRETAARLSLCGECE